MSFPDISFEIDHSRARVELLDDIPRPLNIAEQIRAERDPEYIELRERARELFESRRRKRVYSE